MLRETERDKLIRTGKITPFADMEGLDKGALRSKTTITQSHQPSRIRGLSEGKEREFEEKRYIPPAYGLGVLTPTSFRQQALLESRVTARVPRQRKSRRMQRRRYHDDAVTQKFADDGDDTAYRLRLKDWDSGLLRKKRGSTAANPRAMEGIDNQASIEEEEEEDVRPAQAAERSQNTPVGIEPNQSSSSEWVCSACTFLNTSPSTLSACEVCGTRRPRSRKSPAHTILEQDAADEGGSHTVSNLGEEEETRATDHGEEIDINEPEEGEDVVFSGGYKIPDFIYDNLFDYQQTGLCSLLKWPL